MFIESTCEEWLKSLTIKFSKKMPRITAYKRKRSGSYASSGAGSKRSRLSITRIPRNSRPGSGGNRTIIPLSASYNFDLTADPAYAFAFDTQKYYVNEGAGVAINGATEVASVYDMMRIAKIEFTIVPAATSLDYANQTLSSGATNIPFVYDAVDYNDGAIPSLAEMQ